MRIETRDGEREPVRDSAGRRLTLADALDELDIALHHLAGVIVEIGCGLPARARLEVRGRTEL